ncbi:MAG TPA: nitroreductase family protein [Gammaproteobacteria bacterium]|nr:nitroreductase family protein [Gammaproteobacteria bacterium]
MDVREAIESRRAVKRFDPLHRLTEREVDELLRLARLSPTAFNIQNWRFVLVRDPQRRARIREAAWNQAQMTDASLLVVICADLNAWDRDPARYWRHVPERVTEAMVRTLKGFYGGNAPGQRDEAMRSCGIAAMTLMLAARELGYDSCPMTGFDFDAVAGVINLPEDHVIGLIVTIGRAIEPAGPRGGTIDEAEAVFEDYFDDPGPGTPDRTPDHGAG